MEISNLKKDELLKLRNDIDSQLEYLEKLRIGKEIERQERYKLREKTKISELESGDKIFCFNFNGSKIYHMDYVKIFFHPNDKNFSYINYSTSHATKPMGCSASFHVDYIDKHYFLKISPSHMHFFTLKPEICEEDLKVALDFEIELKKDYFNRDIDNLKSDVADFIEMRLANSTNFFNTK